jgi:hypothetical protein
MNAARLIDASNEIAWSPAKYMHKVSSDLSLITDGMQHGRQNTPESELSSSNGDELQSQSSASSQYTSGVNVSSDSYNMLLVAAIQSSGSNNVQRRMKALKCLFKIATHHQSTLPYIMVWFAIKCQTKVNC